MENRARAVPGFLGDAGIGEIAGQEFFIKSSQIRKVKLTKILNISLLRYTNVEIEKLVKFNEWWTAKKVKPSLLMPYRRPLFFKLADYLESRQINLIVGLRRVGKTTLMYQLIQNLLDKGIRETSIFYFSFDEESAGFEDVIKTYEEKVLKKAMGSERSYIFLDEIQKCKDWQNEIKIYYDLYPNLKFIVSGSASVQLSKKAKESLAGRMFDFVLDPLSFKEFLEWKDVKIDVEKVELLGSKVMPLFYDYLRKGGFPEIVNEEDDEKIKNYIKNNIIERIIFRDLPQEFGIKDYELLKILVEMIALAPGMILNYDALSRQLRRSKKTIMDYFFYLEYAMLIRVIANYRAGFLVSSRKMKKAYIGNTAVSFVYAENFYSDKFLEKTFENLAVIETGSKNYYRNKYEVDIILKTKGGIVPIEVKYGIPDTSRLEKFLAEFKFKKAIVLTKDVFQQRKEISLVPMWAFCISKELYLEGPSGSGI